MSEISPKPQIAPMRISPKTGPSSWKHLDRHLALATRSTAVVADDALLLHAIDECVDEVRTDDWPIELFVSQLRKVLDAAWAGFEGGGLSPRISRREYDRLVVDLLDYAVSRFFQPLSPKPPNTAEFPARPAEAEPTDP